jgi:hypothetical protein
MAVPRRARPEVRFGRRRAAKSAPAEPAAARGTGRPKGARKKPAAGSRAALKSSPRRPPAYFLVAGIRLDQEMDRLRGLPVFAGGPLERRPELKVRRATTRPNRVGFAVPAEHRLQVTAYPGARPGDVLETLLHELVHLHVGRAREAHAWHGQTFKTTLAQAMDEAYEIRGVPTRSTLHGAYAEAIERQRARPQLELDLD